ncbi:MAG: hypothetical protein AAGF31_00160 [Planctomycetota bacterium]
MNESQNLRVHRPQPGAKEKSGAKVRATLYLPPDLLEEARDAVFHLAGYPARMTLTKLAEQAFRQELDRLKQTYNNGEDFPQRTEDLKGGRPIAA